MTIRKLILPNEKGQLQEKAINKPKATAPNKLIIPPGHTLFMLNPKEQKMYSLQVEFTISKNGVARSQINPMEGCLYTVALTEEQARNNFINQINKINNHGKTDGKGI